MESTAKTITTKSPARQNMERNLSTSLIPPPLYDKRVLSIHDQLETTIGTILPEVSQNIRTMLQQILTLSQQHPYTPTPLAVTTKTQNTTSVHLATQESTCPLHPIQEIIMAIQTTLPQTGFRIKLRPHPSLVRHQVSISTRGMELMCRADSVTPRFQSLGWTSKQQHKNSTPIPPLQWSVERKTGNETEEPIRTKQERAKITIHSKNLSVEIPQTAPLEKMITETLLRFFYLYKAALKQNM